MLTLPKIVQLEPKRYVAVRQRVKAPFGDEIPPALDELFAAFDAVGASRKGNEFIKYNRIDMPELEIECGLTTEDVIPLSGRMVEGVLPAGRYVSLSYTGHYDGLLTVNAMLVGWAKETGTFFDAAETPGGDVFAARLEVYHNNPVDEPDPSKWHTTLLFKLKD
ncbi:GyrI-like domain-containing protein [Asticcacaulis sp. ZE23SCel15]|uniref:GyrI-like domain-containing protein n=1 Tax=Asticcacaulis sp. ZE23SCel15 TaxID=3059027 RepID=UPI00265F27A1|nr:GyrI-like domain-containing protein [Asticcacaulis sp. ZE23SCel15]WKL56748.1 GyrI-like domain-containing protein [Asticcacaulis sp. ZE23SCel15]